MVESDLAERRPDGWPVLMMSPFFYGSFMEKATLDFGYLQSPHYKPLMTWDDTPYLRINRVRRVQEGLSGVVGLSLAVNMAADGMYRGVALALYERSYSLAGEGDVVLQLTEHAARVFEAKVVELAPAEYAEKKGRASYLEVTARGGSDAVFEAIRASDAAYKAALAEYKADQKGVPHVAG